MKKMKITKGKETKRSQEKIRSPKHLSKKSLTKLITKDMTIAEVAGKYPETHKVFFSIGMHCLGCPMAMQETIEQGAAAHGANVEELLKKLNNSVKSKKK